MATNVNVKFSASIKDLIDATNSVKGAIDSIVETASKATSILKGFGEAAIAGLSVEGVKSFIESQSQMAEQTERTAAIFGMSTTGAQELGLIARATGGDAEALAMAMQRLQTNLARAATGTGPAAAALKALDINAKSLVGLSIDEQMRKFADSFAKFADGPNKAAVAIALFGRAGAQMIPVLDQGRIGLEMLRQTADYVAISPENIESWAKLGRSTTTLKTAISNLAGTLTGEFTSGLTTATNKLTGFIGAINTAANAGTLWERVLNLIKTTAVEVAKAEDISGSGGNIVSAANAQLAAERLNLLRTTGTKTLAELMGHANTTKHSFQEMWDTMLGIGGKKPQMPAMDLNAKDSINALKTQYESMIKTADDAFNLTKEKLSEQFKVHEITYDQETKALLAALEKRRSAETEAIDAELLLYARGSADYEKVLAERKKLDDKYALDHQKIIGNAIVEDQHQWESLLTPVASAFDSQLKGLLNHTLNWQLAMREMFQQLAMDAIKWLEKIAIEQAALGLAKMFGGGPQSMLGGLFGGGAAASGKAGGAGGAAGEAAAAVTTANTTAVLAQTVSTDAQTVATTANTTATAASGAGAAAGGAGGMLSGFASLFKMFAIPGFAVGTGRVMQTGLAVVHQGNTITAARGNGPYNGPGSGSFASEAPDMHLHIHAIDTQTGADFIDKNIRPIARKLQDHWRNNFGDRPGG